MNLLMGLCGERNVAVIGSRKWLLDYYLKGPPPVAIEFLNKRSKFFEKIVKLLDLKKTIDARAILVASRGTIDQDSVSLANSFGIYIVLSNDESGFKGALTGGDIQEINGQTCARLLEMRSRKIAKECRVTILEVLGKECLTYKELSRRLNLRFSERTVYTQLRSLRSKGLIVPMYRRADGKVVFGLPGVEYPLREDLSKKSRVAYVKKLVLNLLRTRTKPMSYLEIMKELGLRRSLVTSALRDLKKKGAVVRGSDGWSIRSGHIATD